MTKTDIQVSVKYFFEQVGKSGTCGICVVNTILKMFSKRGLIFLSSYGNGTSVRRILHELRKAGLIAVAKTISPRNLKPRSILWYPLPLDHYVVVGEITSDGWYVVYDSTKKAPHLSRLRTIKKKWCKKDKYGRNRGWVIEVSAE